MFALTFQLVITSATTCGEVKKKYQDQCCGGTETDSYDVCQIIGSPPDCEYEFTVLEPDVITDTNRENFNVMEAINFDSVDQLTLIRHLKFENVSTEYGDKLGQFQTKQIVIGDSLFVSFSGPNKPGTDTTGADAAQFRPFYVARVNRFTMEQYWVCKLNDVFDSYEPWKNWEGRDSTLFWGGVTPNIQLHHMIPLSEDGEAMYLTNTKFHFGNEADDYWLIKMDASKTGNCNVLYGTQIGAIPERYINGNAHLQNPGYATVTRSSPNVFKDEARGDTLIAVPLQSSMEYFLATHFMPATFIPRVTIDQVGAYSQVGGICFVRDTGTALVYQDTHLFAPERLEGFTDSSRTDFQANILKRENGKPIKQFIDLCTYQFVTLNTIFNAEQTLPYDCSLSSSDIGVRYFPRGYVRKQVTEQTASVLTNDSFIGDENCLELNVPISKHFLVTDGSGNTADVANLDQMLVKSNSVELYTCPYEARRIETVALTCKVPFYLHDVADLHLDRDVTMEVNAWYDMISNGTYMGIAKAYSTGQPNGKTLEIVPRDVPVTCTDSNGTALPASRKTFTAINPNDITAVQANFPIGNQFTHPGGPFTYDAMSSCGPAFWVCDTGDKAPLGGENPSSNSSCLKYNLHIKREYVVGKLTKGTTISNTDATFDVKVYDGTSVAVTGLMLHRQEVRKSLCRNLVDAGYPLDASEAYRLNYAGTGTWGQGMGFDAVKRELIVPTSNANWMPNHEMISLLNSTVLRDPVDVMVDFQDGSVSTVSPKVPSETFLVSGHDAIFYTTNGVPNIESSHSYTNETSVSMRAYTFYPHGIWGYSKIDNYNPDLLDPFQFSKEAYYITTRNEEYPTKEDRDAAFSALLSHWKRMTDRLVSEYASLVSPRGRQFTYTAVVGVNIDSYEMVWRTAPSELDIGWHSERWFSGDIGTFYPFEQNPRGNAFAGLPDDAASGMDRDYLGNYPRPPPYGIWGFNMGPQVSLEDLHKRINNLPWGGDSDVSSQVVEINGKWYAVSKPGCLYTVLNSSDVDTFKFVSHSIMCPTPSSDFVGNFNYGFSVAKVREYWIAGEPQPTEHRIVYTLKNLADVGNPFVAIDRNGDLKRVPYGTKVLVIHDVERGTVEYLDIPDTSVMEAQDGATGVNCFRADRDRHPVCYYMSDNGQLTFVDLGTKRTKKMQLRSGNYRYPPLIIDDAMYYWPDTFDATQTYLGNQYSQRAKKSNKYIDIYTMGPRGIKRTCK